MHDLKKRHLFYEYFVNMEVFSLQKYIMNVLRKNGFVKIKVDLMDYNTGVNKKNITISKLKLNSRKYVVAGSKYPLTWKFLLLTGVALMLVAYFWLSDYTRILYGVSLTFSVSSFFFYLVKDIVLVDVALDIAGAGRMSRILLAFDSDENGRRAMRVVEDEAFPVNEAIEKKNSSKRAIVVEPEILKKEILKISGKKDAESVRKKEMLLLLQEIIR